MPIIWDCDHSKLGVYKDELIPRWWPTWDALRQALARSSKRGYGPARLHNGGGLGEVLIDYDSLDREIQASITDLRKADNYHIMEKWYAEDAETKDYYTTYRTTDEPDSYLKGAKQSEYIINASVLKAVRMYRDAHVEERAKKNKKATKLYEFMANEAQAFQTALKRITGLTHTLPPSERAFRDVFDKFFASEGLDYEAIIHRGHRNSNAKKIHETVQEALLRKLLRHANNLNYEQVRKMYNEVAVISDWKPISRRKVEQFADENKLTLTGGRRGEVEFDNTLAMQHKRRDIAYPMLMWSVDGWDVELLYQQTALNAKGQNVTTYHNRPTLVVILDPHSSYPIGYAIGTHETPALIRAALRNALNHTEQLFECRHRPQQVQSDRYGNGSLRPIFEAASAKAYTPAKVRNAKAKYVEKYFDNLNENYCQFLNNWSGHNVTARKENQPNTEWKNKVRHSFPDWQGVVKQIETIIETERNKKRGAYLEGWAKLPDMYRAPINTENFLLSFGEVKERTTKLRGNGLVFDIAGAEYSFDSFDMAFRSYAHIDWKVRYDLENMETVLATNEDGNVRFLLDAKHEEGGTIAERTTDDYQYGARIDQFNKQMKEHILTQTAEEHEVVDNFLQSPQLRDTLSKMLLIDSMGQHKDQRNQAIKEAAKRIAAPTPQQDNHADIATQRRAWIASKVNINDYLND